MRKPTIFLLSWVFLLACPAPESRPLTGEIAQQAESSIASGQATFDHTDWDTLLQEISVEGLVDYRNATDRRAELDSYLVSLASADLGILAPDHLKALLINAYNAYTLASILDHPGVESIRDIRGVWDRTEHSVGGFALTLDQIEHNLLRPFFRDPRIHFVLNCASSSCAVLPPWAYSGESLEEQIEQSSKAFLQDLGNVRLEGSSLLLSSYFDWYASDFIEADWHPRADSVPDFVALYATAGVAKAIQSNAQITIRFLDYDWSLNAARH